MIISSLIWSQNENNKNNNQKHTKKNENDHSHAVILVVFSLSIFVFACLLACIIPRIIYETIQNCIQNLVYRTFNLLPHKYTRRQFASSTSENRFLCVRNNNHVIFWFAFCCYFAYALKILLLDRSDTQHRNELAIRGFACVVKISLAHLVTAFNNNIYMQHTYRSQAPNSFT